MHIILSAFRQLLYEIWEDKMLTLSLIGPILLGLVLKLGIPYIIPFIFNYMGHTDIPSYSVLFPYYLLADLILCMLTPMLISFSGAMVILDEVDSKVANYLIVTPLTKRGYLIARIGLPSLVSVAYTIIIVSIFSLTHLTLLTITILSVLNALMGIIISLFIVVFSTNRVEGMALAKLSGFFIIGLPLALFITPPLQYIGTLLPTFWIASFVLSPTLITIIAALLSCSLWIGLLYNRFIKKIM